MLKTIGLSILCIFLFTGNIFGAIEVKEDGTSKGFVQRLDFQNGPTVTRSGIEADIDFTGVGGGGWIDDGTVVRLTTATDNVGIGTTSAWQKLTVSGDMVISDTSGNLTIRDSSDDTALNIHYDTAAAPQDLLISIGTDDGSATGYVYDIPVFSANSSGNVMMPNEVTVGGDFNASGDINLNKDLIVTDSLIIPLK